MALKSLEYFLDKEKKYVQEWGNKPFTLTARDGVVPANSGDPLSFLEDGQFSEMHREIKTDRSIQQKLRKYNLSDVEGLMLMVFEGTLSRYFREDYYKGKVPPFVFEMQKCLYSVISKAPVFNGKQLYRFCVSQDKTDFRKGDIYRCEYSLTTTKNNWEKDTNRYIIETRTPNKTNARCLYEIYNHGEENQVNFLPNTYFKVINVENTTRFGMEYKHIYLKECSKIQYLWHALRMKLTQPLILWLRIKLQ